MVQRTGIHRSLPLHGVLIAALAACGGEAGGAPQHAPLEVHRGVELHVGVPVETAGEPWYVDDLNHLHGGGVGVDHEGLESGGLRVRVRPLGVVAGFATELEFTRGDDDEPGLALNVHSFHTGDAIVREVLEDLRGNVWINTPPWERDPRFECEFALHGTVRGEPLAVRGAFSFESL